jgi:hypothetical protein
MRSGTIVHKFPADVAHEEVISIILVYFEDICNKPKSPCHMIHHMISHLINHLICEASSHLTQGQA